MLSDRHILESFVYVPSALPCQLICISFIDRDGELEIAEGSANFLKLAKISAKDRYVSGATVRSLLEEVEDQFSNHINLGQNVDKDH